MIEDNLVFAIEFVVHRNVESILELGCILSVVALVKVNRRDPVFGPLNASPARMPP